MIVTSIGPEVLDYLRDERIMVTFEEGAPPELADVSVLHTHGPLAAPVQVGDTVDIGGKRFEVTAVGDVANQNLQGLGHAIFRFDGADEPDMPGCIHLGNGGPLTIEVGSTIRILREQGGPHEERQG